LSHSGGMPCREPQDGTVPCDAGSQRRNEESSLQGRHTGRRCGHVPPPTCGGIPTVGKL